MLPIADMTSTDVGLADEVKCFAHIAPTRGRTILGTGSGGGETKDGVRSWLLAARAGISHQSSAHSDLSFPKIISARSDDAIRLGLVWRRWSRIGSCHRLHLRHRLPHTQMFRDELGPDEHVGLLAARGTWLLAVVLAAVRRMMTAH